MATRRDFVKSAALLGSLAAVGLSGNAFAKSEGVVQAAGGGKTPMPVGGHKLPKLPYAYDALAPYIDAKTLEIHHSRHHQGYVNGLNATEEEIQAVLKQGGDALDKVPKLMRNLAFHGSGHVNHTLYWMMMAPYDKAQHAPAGALADKIKQDFGSIEAFKALFSKASAKAEGNGWGALVYHPSWDRLYVTTLLNHQNSMLAGGVPLLLCDVWEHAYYVKYNNKRGDYIENWWKVVDWKNVGQRFDAVSGWSCSK